MPRNQHASPRWVAPALAALLAACGSPSAPADAGLDGAVDAGQSPDAGVDAGRQGSCVAVSDGCGAPGDWRVHFSDFGSCQAAVQDRDLDLVLDGGALCTRSRGVLTASARGCTIDLDFGFAIGPPEPGSGRDHLVLTFDGGDVASGHLAYSQRGVSNCDNPSIAATAFRADSGVLPFRGQACQLADAGSCPAGLGCYSQYHPACDLEGWLEGGASCAGDSQCRAGLVCAEPGTGVSTMTCVAVCTLGAPASACPAGLTCRAAGWLGPTTGLCKP